MEGLILIIAPIPEVTFLDNLSMRVCHRRFSSINIQSDLTEETYSIWTLSIKSSSGFDKVINFFMEPININSVLVLFKVSLLEISHLFKLSKSWFRFDCIKIHINASIGNMGVISIHPRLAWCHLLWRRANARNVSFLNISQGNSTFINSFDKTKFLARCLAVWQVININQKYKGAKDCSLRYSAFKCTNSRERTVEAKLNRCFPLSL